MLDIPITSIKDLKNTILIKEQSQLEVLSGKLSIKKNFMIKD